MSRRILQGFAVRNKLVLTISALAVCLSAAASQPPPTGDFHRCPVAGISGDSVLNSLKNRASEVGQSREMSVSDVEHLPVPRAATRKKRARWPSVASRVVAPYEKEGVTVEGFLAGVRQEGKEAPNCDARDLHDFHTWLVAASGQSKAGAFVAEITPRWRAANAGWNLKTLERLARQHARVRVTGWLLFDQEHPEQLGKTRATLWEIHPITKIEVFSAGRWREL